MLENCARWIAEEADHFGIPIVRLSSDAAQGSGRGVCQHVDLGLRGGDLHDCGSGFPMARVLEMAHNIDGLGQSVSKSPWYFIQDPEAVRLASYQRMYYGGWNNDSGRNTKLKELTERYGHSFRVFEDEGFPSSFFIDNSEFVNEIYGGWQNEDSRDDVQEQLEHKLGRSLRSFSESRTQVQGGVPWGCKNLVQP
jgi:hypothetical protein